MCDNITLRQSVSQRLSKIFLLLNSSSQKVFPTSHNTTRTWIVSAFAKEKNTICTHVTSAYSRISISFDAWSSNNDLPLLGVVAHLMDEKHELKTLLLGLSEINSHSGIEQSRVLLQVLQDYGINGNNLGWFVLDNASNSDTALVELAKSLSFDPLKKKLRCVGHMISLAADAFLTGGDPADLDKNIRKEQSETEKLKLWRERGPVGKLQNTVIHITRSSRRKNLFNKCQENNSAQSGNDRIYVLVRDGGVRWNSTYMMVERALKLRDSLKDYNAKMQRSTDPADSEVCLDDITSDDWEMLVKVKGILKPLFIATKRMEGNAIEGLHGSCGES